MPQKVEALPDLHLVCGRVNGVDDNLKRLFEHSSVKELQASIDPQEAILLDPEEGLEPFTDELDQNRGGGLNAFHLLDYLLNLDWQSSAVQSQEQ